MRVIVAAIGATALLTLAACERGMGPRAGKFDGESALRYAKAQVDFGPRVPGTPAAQKAGDWIIRQMRARADTVRATPTAIEVATRMAAVNRNRLETGTTNRVGGTTA